MHRKQTREIRGTLINTATQQNIYSDIFKQFKRCLHCMLTLVLLMPGPSYSSTAVTDVNPTISKVHRFRLLAFGTYIEFMITSVTVKEARLAKKLVRTQFLTMHRQWHSSQNSLVFKLSQRLATGKWIPLPQAVRDLLIRSQQIAIKSNHLFNPAIGRLVNLWGFNNSLKPRTQPPSISEIDKLVRLKARMSDLEIKGKLIRSRNPAVQLDFGAIAKGYAIDHVATLLKLKGFHNFIINAGGDLKAIGRHPLRSWRIAVRDPANKSQIIAGIEVKDEEAVFTSGDYERYFMYQGKRFHHILNPLNGRPVRHTRSVTVLHSDATLADAAATALFVTGPKDWPSMAKRLGLRYVMLIDSKGTIHLSHAMKLRIQLFNVKRYRIHTVHLK